MNETNLPATGTKCSIVGCKHKGKKIGSFADTDIFYCAKHWAKGSNTMDFLLKGKYGLVRFLQLRKQKKI